MFYAFDVLHLDGKDPSFLASQELPGTPAAIVESVRGLGFEGVIAKRKDSLYEPGERTDDWQKLKLENQQEFVIGGYRPGSNGVDVLLVADKSVREVRRETIEERVR